MCSNRSGELVSVVGLYIYIYCIYIKFFTVHLSVLQSQNIRLLCLQSVYIDDLKTIIAQLDQVRPDSDVI